MRVWVMFIYGVGTVSVTAWSRLQALQGLAAFGYNKVSVGEKVTVL
jgi:hypothetical protein